MQVLLHHNCPTLPGPFQQQPLDPDRAAPRQLSLIAPSLVVQLPLPEVRPAHTACHAPVWLHIGVHVGLLGIKVVVSSPFPAADSSGLRLSVALATWHCWSLRMLLAVRCSSGTPPGLPSQWLMPTSAVQLPEVSLMSVEHLLSLSAPAAREQVCLTPLTHAVPGMLGVSAHSFACRLQPATVTSSTLHPAQPLTHVHVCCRQLRSLWQADLQPALLLCYSSSRSSSCTWPHSSSSSSSSSRLCNTQQLRSRPPGSLLGHRSRRQALQRAQLGCKPLSRLPWVRLAPCAAADSWI